MIVRILRALRERGPVGALRAAWDVGVVAPRQRRRRPTAKPSLKDLVRSTTAIEVRAEDLLARLGLAVTPDLSAAADAHLAELARRTEARELFFPERFAVERESGRFLYLLVRTARPTVMLETGVANGASTFLILTAMQENGVGRLVSVDVTDRVAALLTEEERSRPAWELRVIEPGGFGPVVAGLGAVDVFLHDSDHSYGNVVAEVTAAWPHVRPGGFVLSDDGELSFAFLDAVAGRSSEVLALFDRRKLLMATRR